MNGPLLTSVSIIGLVAVGGSLSIAMVQVLANLVRDWVHTRHQETSRREIAAYVAEGSISSDEGERLMNAGRPVPSSCSGRKTRG